MFIVPKVGDLAVAMYVANIQGDGGLLRGVVVSVAEPHSRFNATDKRTVSVKSPDGSEGTSNSSQPVTVLFPAGSPEAREAVRELLASGTRLSSRARAALEGTL